MGPPDAAQLPPRQHRAHRHRSRSPLAQEGSPPQQHLYQHQQQQPSSMLMHSDGSDGSEEEGTKGRKSRMRNRNGAASECTWGSLLTSSQTSDLQLPSDDTPPARGSKRAKGQAAKEAKAEARELKRRANEEAKKAKLLAREQARLDKAAAKEQGKMNKKEANEVQRVLKGSNVERDMVLHLSGRVLEQPWGATLLHTLQDQGIEYKIEAFPGPLSGYAWMRWGRRMPRAAAQAFMDLQGQGPAQQQQQGDALAACNQAMELLPSNPDKPNEAELGFQLLLVFLPPADLVAQLRPAAGPGHAGAGNSREGLLHALRATVRAALPGCTLMVGCVGLSRHLDAEERAPGSLFNRSTVEDALLDLAMRFPAVRLRTDLMDGAHAADVLVTTTACLATHHKRQQDGYLKSFGASRLPSSHASLEGVHPACKVTATALCHLLPPDKAVAVALKYQSMGALMAAYAAQSTLRGKEEMLVGLSLDAGKGRALGKKASQDVYRYLHCADPSAQAKDTPQDD